MITHVQEFNEKFGLPLGDEDVLTSDPEAIEYRIKFIQEELDELKHALAAGDRIEAFDALLDITYVVQGTALFMGIDPIQWAVGMNAVHAANMAKERVVSPDQSKRKSSFDCRKPDGWVSPQARLEEILAWKK